MKRSNESEQNEEELDEEDIDETLADRVDEARSVLERLEEARRDNKDGKRDRVKTKSHSGGFCSFSTLGRRSAHANLQNQTHVTPVPESRLRLGWLPENGRSSCQSIRRYSSKSLRIFE